MQRGYPEMLIDSEMEKVVLSKEKRLRNKRLKDIPLVVIYHPLLRQLAGIIQKHLYLLHMNVEVAKIFIPAPMVSY